MSFLKAIFGGAPAPDYTFVTARLNAKVQPVARYECFEKHLEGALKAQGLGEVTGGGTQLTDDPYGIAYCDIEIGLTETSPEAINHLIAALEATGAPKGSSLRFDDPARDPIPFGTDEGLCLALNGTDLPDEVYANSDVNELIETLDTALGAAGEMKGHWQGERDTMLYFYGRSYAEMDRIIRPITDRRPDTQLSRIEQIA